MLFVISILPASSQVKVTETGEFNLGYDSDHIGTIAFGNPKYMYLHHPTNGITDSTYIGYDFSISYKNDMINIAPTNHYGVIITKTGVIGSSQVGIGKIPTNGYKLDVSGNIRVSGTITQSSDARLKTDIQSVNDRILDLYSLEGKSFYKHLPESQQSENPEEDIPTFEFGFIAQEFQESFPELVSEDDEGYLGLNYIALIPVIVETLKSQKEEIELLKQEIEFLTLGSNSPAYAPSSSSSSNSSSPLNETATYSEIIKKCILFQNTPNPFNVSTKISYELPTGINSAEIFIFNLQGNLMKQMNAESAGYVEVSAHELTPGLYLYTLVVDGVPIDTKRMILTDK